MDSSSNWSRAMAGKGWEGEAPGAPEPQRTAGSCTTSGRATPASVASDPGHSNEATAGSLTDHDLLSAGEEDEETLSVDASSSPMKLIKNDLTLEVEAAGPASGPAADALDLYGVSYHDTKENFYKDMPTSSKNYNVESNTNKCTKDRMHFASSNIDSLNLQSRDISRSKDEILNNGSRRYSDSVAQKSNLTHVAGSRFKTSLVSEELLRSSAPSENCEHDPEPRGFSDMP